MSAQPVLSPEERAHLKKTRETNQRREIANDLRCVMKERAGRRYVWRRLMNRHLFEPIGDGGNALDLAKENALRNTAAIEWREVGEQCPELRALMVLENMEGFEGYA